MSYICVVCGKEAPEGEAFIHDGQAYCFEHFDQHFTTCDCCGAIVNQSDITIVHGGNAVCEECLDREYVQCPDCDEWFPEEDMTVVNRGDLRDEILVCDDCLHNSINYYRCDSCGEWVTDRHVAMSDDSGTIICDGCDDDYYVCDDCGRIVHIDDVYWDDDTDEHFCRDCWDRRRTCNLHEYGFKPYPVFGTTDEHDGADRYYGHDLTFGVELECDDGENREAAVQEIAALTDRVYCKRDGSLHNGYEVVTHPGTLEWHMTRFPWDDVCKISRQYNFSSHDAGTCGLHIHIGKVQLETNIESSNTVTGKLILLTNVVWPELVRFSRRGGEVHWAERNRGVETLTADLSDDAAMLNLYRSSRRAGRYLAVNVTNDSTVELRFNRGTLKLGTIYASLQLASNLALFARDHSVDEIIDAKWDDIVHYREYDALTDYVSRRFDGFEPGDRPKVNFRKADIYEAPAFTEGSPDFLRRAAEVLRGSILAPRGTDAQPGDIVVSDGVYPEDIPVRGTVGIALEDGAVFWNDDRPDSGLHANSRPDLPRRQWYVGTDEYRVVSRLGAIAGDDGSYDQSAYTALVNRGFCVGDLAKVDGHEGVILRAFNTMFGPVVYLSNGLSYSINDLRRV